MHSLSVELPDSSYEIVIERGLIDQLGHFLRSVVPRAQLAVVCDEHVAALYAERLGSALTQAAFAYQIVRIPAGEHSKSLDTLGMLYQRFAEQGLSRSDAVVALGGGVVGDVAGLAAATMLRGISLIQVPTTLLAQVDSSVGGKVAINLSAGKNLVGAFYQPKLVLIDPDCLDSLPERVVADGMAEVIKYGALCMPNLLDTVHARPNYAQLRSSLPEIIRDCCAIKRDLVVADEHDTAERQLLNFGHTLGHAYERAYNYHSYTHGEAVAAGMCSITAYGERYGLTQPGTWEQLVRICTAWNLPSSIACSADDLATAIAMDKKGSAADITLVLLHQPGQAYLHHMSKARFLQELTA